MNKNEYKLSQGIIARSESKTWDRAKLEWDLKDVYEEEEPDTCLCGHYPIIEICLLVNRLNKNDAIVGNCCVKKFMGLSSGKIFDAIKRVRKDNKKSLNPETIEHAMRSGWITDWEHGFYINIWRRILLSQKQARIKMMVNTKVLAGLSKNRRTK